MTGHGRCGSRPTTRDGTAAQLGLIPGADIVRRRCGPGATAADAPSGRGVGVRCAVDARARPRGGNSRPNALQPHVRQRDRCRRPCSDRALCLRCRGRHPGTCCDKTVPKQGSPRQLRLPARTVGSQSTLDQVRASTPLQVVCSQTLSRPAHRSHTTNYSRGIK